QDLRAVGVASEHEEMAVVHVTELVAEDGGQLRLVLDTAQEAGVKDDAAFRHGEGGQSRITKNEELDDGAGGPDLDRADLGGYAAQILPENRVLVDRHPREQALLFALRLAPQSAFLGRRREWRAAGADGRNTSCAGHGRQSDQQHPYEGAGALPHVS